MSHRHDRIQRRYLPLMGWPRPVHLPHNVSYWFTSIKTLNLPRYPYAAHDVSMKRKSSSESGPSSERRQNATPTPLSPLDNVMARYYGKFILGFTIEHDQDPKTVFEYLRQSFSATIATLPFLAGKLILRPPDRVHSQRGTLAIESTPVLNCDAGPQLQFRDLATELDFEAMMEEGLPESAMDGELLLPAAFRPDLENGADIIVAQCNFVQGGCFLGVGLFHSVCDGSGLNTIVKLWADNCRSLQSGKTAGHRFVIPPASFDRGLLKNIWLREGNQETSPEDLDTSEDLWRLLGLNPVNLTNSSEPFAPDEPSKAASMESPTMETSIFYVSQASFARLKRNVSKDLDQQGGVLSANDALMALLWRCIMKARFPVQDAESGELDALLDTTVDGRAQFSDKLPPSYLGNIILINTSSLPLSTLTAPSTTLSMITSEIRKSLNQITKSRVHAAFAIASCIPDYTQLSFPFATFEGAEVCITSLLNIPLFELDFGPVFGGGGRPQAVRPPREEFDKICRRVMIMPLRMHGGFEILITLLKSEMQKLRVDQELKEYAKFCCN